MDGAVDAEAKKLENRIPVTVRYYHYLPSEFFTKSLELSATAAHLEKIKETQLTMRITSRNAKCTKSLGLGYWAWIAAKVSRQKPNLRKTINFQN